MNDEERLFDLWRFLHLGISDKCLSDIHGNTLYFDEESEEMKIIKDDR